MKQRLIAIKAIKTVILLFLPSFFMMSSFLCGFDNIDGFCTYLKAAMGSDCFQTECPALHPSFPLFF